LRIEAVIGRWRDGVALARAQARDSQDWLRRNRGCLFVAIANLMQHRRRRLVAILGTAVPILLLFFQIAFLHAARTQVTRLYDDFDFDLAVIPQSYEFLFQSGTFDRSRLMQARALDGVADTYRINIGSASWIENDTGRRSSLLLIGLDDGDDFVRDPMLREALPALGNGHSVLADDFSGSDYGPLKTGTRVQIANQPMDIVGHFRLGLFFYTDGSAIVRNTDFSRLERRAPDAVSIGLVRVAPGADIADVKSRLAGALGEDVRILTRDELFRQEQDFFLSTKPVGIMLAINMWIAFIVGAVILWQVLSTEIANRITEFATMKAMGFAQSFVFGVGVIESVLMALAAFVPAFFAAALILLLVDVLTHFPTAISPALILEVLGIVLLMALVSAAIAVRRIAHADPAELY
jgi:putative ABC transport system permease protein